MKNILLTILGVLTAGMVIFGLWHDHIESREVDQEEIRQIHE